MKYLLAFFASPFEVRNQAVRGRFQKEFIVSQSSVGVELNGLGNLAPRVSK